MRFSYTKQAAVIEMLRRPEGATIVEIQWITGWQKHTINGMFNHTLKKRLGMNVVRVDGERRYRIDWTTARERAINRSSLGEYNRMIVHAQAQLAVKPMTESPLRRSWTQPAGKRTRSEASSPAR